MRGIHALAAGAALALGLAALAGTAVAGNGTGNSGNGNGNQPAAPSAPESAPGNSANAPGQVKQESQPAAQPAAKSSSPGQQKQAAKAASSSSQAGVKPSSTTKHWTKTSVGASPDVSKRYGNGKTAAQIAASRGAPADTKLTGPGNSQPHKVTACGKPSNKSGGVDVHAVKSYSASACTPKSAPGAQVPAASPAVAPSVPAAAPPTSAAPTAATAPSAGGVLGTQATISSPAAKPSGAGSVLGTVARVAGTQLPFTGLALWIAVLIASGLVTAGVLVRRHGREPART